MILIKNINLPLNFNFSFIKEKTADILKTDIKNIKTVTLYKKSIDARHKDNVHFCCSFLTDTLLNEEKIIKRIKNAEIYTQKPYIQLYAKSDNRPVVIGFGPSGMFCALILARAGLNPIVIERGKRIEERQRDVETFLKGGRLNTESNVLFGEGGAGTFSDGKLNSGIKDNRCRFVLETFYNFGATENILYDAKPHIGTDILSVVVKNIREEIINHGGEILFETRADKINIENNRVKSVSLSNGKIIDCDDCVIATGHSARDTYAMLRDIGVNLVRKPFSVGARIEHLQKDINKQMYGDFAENGSLGAADYKLAVHLENGRGVYTFCMCPGGYVINSSSEEGMTAVNGMSYSARDGENANSAILVEVRPDDIPGDDVLGGIEFQREIESNAYKIGGGSVPVCTVGDLLNNKKDGGNKVKPTVKPNTVNADISDVLPQFVVDSIKLGLPLLDKKIKGFANPYAILTFPETRSSSPVRITRNENLNSVSANGLYPAGEGAGYAGGIMSAAVDGIRIAEQIIKQCN